MLAAGATQLRHYTTFLFIKKIYHCISYAPTREHGRNLQIPHNGSPTKNVEPSYMALLLVDP